ncbi:TIGR04372 family glycosyltransferase [Candidatus Pelagibacter sp.]|nr:TIGR04372 family glycosyltransferase [Candidatus Pelagibacter sp.]
MITKKILLNSILIVSYLLSPIIFILIKFIKPILLIRITPILSNRYGHLAINPEIYLIEKKKEKIKKNFFDLFYTVRYGVCNYEMLKLWKTKIIIFPHYLIEPIDLLLNGKKKTGVHQVNFFSSKIRDISGNYNKDTPSIKLSEKQNAACIDQLKKFGLDFNKEKYVCLFNRDDAFLNSNKHKKDWYYLSHHNYKIQSFEMAARKLSSKNIKVFRMGVKVEGKFDFNDRNIIDYANSGLRNELMDIFLASNCFFGIHCGTGSANVAILNRRPILDLNANLHHLYTFLDNSLLLSKHYYSKRKKRNLNLSEILAFKENEIRRRDQLDSYEIEMIDCSQEEIADAVEELYLRLENKWNDTDEILSLQKKFNQHNWKNIYQLQGDKTVFYHGEIKGRYSSAFLLKNKDWLN